MAANTRRQAYRQPYQFLYNDIVTDTLLQTKLHIPPLRSSLVPRPRLIARLNAGLGDLPLIVLTAGITADEMYAQVTGVVRSVIGRDVYVKVYEANQELQQELANLPTQGKQVIVEDSGHYIQWDQPAVVIDAIRTIVEQVRSE